MITNAKQTDWRTQKLPPVKLLNTSILLQLPIWLRKATALDIQSFYTFLKLPEELQAFLGLPKVLLDGEWWFPVNIKLPMGWTGSVLLVQEVHESLFARAVAE